MRIKPKNWEAFQHYKDRAPPWIKLHHKLLDDQEFNSLSPMACKVLVLAWLLASESIGGSLDGSAAKIAFRMRLPEEFVGPALDELLSAGFLIPADQLDAASDGLSVADQRRENAGFSSRYIPDAVRRAAWARDGGKCVSCGSEEKVEYDHIVPVSAGGESSLENIQLLCRGCNRRKRTKSAEQLATQAQPALGRRTTETETEAERDKKPLRVASDTFSRFWETWPASPRKVAKAKCAEVWARRRLDSVADAIVAHVTSARDSNQWQRGYEPAPLTYLNQRRWEDGAPAGGGALPSYT